MILNEMHLENNLTEKQLLGKLPSMTKPGYGDLKDTASYLEPQWLIISLLKWNIIPTWGKLKKCTKLYSCHVTNQCKMEDYVWRPDSCCPECKQKGEPCIIFLFLSTYVSNVPNIY